MGLSSGKKTKQTTTTTPWAPAQPSITGALTGLDAANQNATQAIQQFTPSLDAAISKATGTMNNPPQYLTDARTQLDKTINGDYVNSNPWTGAMADQIAQKTGAQYNSTFGARGRATGGLAALLSGQGVGDALANFYGGQYNMERGIQNQAIGAAPAFHQDEYTDANNAANLINQRVMLPLTAANSYGAGVTQVSSPYNTSTTVQKQSGGMMQQIIGLGLMAAGAATGNPALMMAGSGMAGGGGGGGGMMGLLGGGGGNAMGSGVNLGGGTANYFAAHPFGG
jgi:hypothetical protein